MSGLLVRKRQRGEPGLQGRHQLAQERLEREEMQREVPVSSATMIELMMRYCAADPDASDTVSYTDLISNVLEDADKHKMGVRDQERLLECCDGDCDGKLNPMEAASVQYFMSAPNGGWEHREMHERVTYHGDVSKMKICADEMFGKLQLRSMSFLRLCLERSGKPVVIRDSDFTRVVVPEVTNELDSEDNATSQKRAHFAAAEVSTESAKTTKRSLQSTSDKRNLQMQQWLEVATEAMSPTSRQQQEREPSGLVKKGMTAFSLSGNIDVPSSQRGKGRPVTNSSDTMSKFSVASRNVRATTRMPIEVLQGIVVESSPRRCADVSSAALSPMSSRLLDMLKTSSQKVRLNALIQSLEPAPGSNTNVSMMTNAQWTRGKAKIWGGNWGLRDCNTTIQHDVYRLLESPSGGRSNIVMTAREKKMLQPVPEVHARGDKAIENELKKIFKAYARPTGLFPDADSNVHEARGKHDGYTDRKIGELVLGTNLAQKEKFEALDDNGNGKLSCMELKMGMRNMGNVWLGMHRTKLFLGARADDDLSYYEFIGIVKDRINERCNSLREGGSRNTKEFFEQWHDRYVEPYHETMIEDEDEFGVSIGHLGFRRHDLFSFNYFVSRCPFHTVLPHVIINEHSQLDSLRFVADLQRFQKQNVHLAQLDKVFLLGAGYDTAMSNILEFVRDNNPVDTIFPVCIGYRRFRNALLRNLALLVAPTPPPDFMGLPEEYNAERFFIRHVVIPNAKRPSNEPGHPLYMNFYKEDVLSLLRSYETVLQFVFAHYATLESYYKSKLSEKMNGRNFPSAWGPGNGLLRLRRSEFLAFCENFGIIGSISRLASLAQPLIFTRATANWVFTSAKNGAEASSLCEECKHSQLPGCDHMTFREFTEAILRCAIILFPPEGLQFHDLDTAPVSNFDKVDRTAAVGTLKKLVPHKWNLENSTFHPSRSALISTGQQQRSASCDPMIEASFHYRSDGSLAPDTWARGRLSPISQRMPRRGAPGHRQSLLPVKIYTPSPHMVKPETPKYRAWSRNYQPGSPGVKHDVMSIRPL